MSLLPPYLDTKMPEAVRGTNRLRSIDPNLIVGWDTRRGVFTVYGPSIAFRGWVPIADCADDQGRPFRQIVPWELIMRGLVEAQDGPSSAEKALAHNERQHAARQADLDARNHAAAEYFDDAMQGEIEGWGRHRGQDVADGWKSATASQKPEPVGQRVFAQGVQPRTGG
jgi:hypothetical protein